MEQCSAHVNFQLPNKSTRVGYLLDGIECSDAPLQAAMALVRNDDAVNGKRNDFEATALFIVPHCPIARKHSTGNKCGMAQILDAVGKDDKQPPAEVGAVSGSKKVSFGKTGVEFRFYKKQEYEKLSDTQKKELKEHCEKNGNDKVSKKQKAGGGKEQQKMISAAIAEHMEAQKKEAEEAQQVEKLMKDYILSVCQSMTKGTASANSSAVNANAKPITLQSILKQVKN